MGCSKGERGEVQVREVNVTVGCFGGDGCGRGVGWEVEVVLRLGFWGGHDEGFRRDGREGTELRRWGFMLAWARSMRILSSLGPEN